PCQPRLLNQFATLVIPISLHPSPLFFFTDTSTPEIYTLSLHDALPISVPYRVYYGQGTISGRVNALAYDPSHPGTYYLGAAGGRSEEHTSELQSRGHLVCRLLLEKKKKISM